MKTYKYFYKTDLKKEKIGIIKSESLSEAFIFASKTKDLPLKDFKEIFDVKKI
jgi:hypothetical protein|tara:strand:+ start:384 stop:542 length:159 start_codon:yes stop_codon:yes gene_type:complete